MTLLYCDQDGVLADFGPVAEKFFNISFKNFVKLDGNDWHRFQKAQPWMWKELPLCPRALELWSVIRPYCPSILTAIPNAGTWDGVAEQKTAWCREKLPKFGYCKTQRVITCERAQKQSYAVQEDGTANLLIDDMVQNIAEWTEAGGIGIHWTGTDESLEAVRAACIYNFGGWR